MKAKNEIVSINNRVEIISDLFLTLFIFEMEQSFPIQE